VSEIGNFKGSEPLRSDEEQSHWGLFAIVSAPLELGCDLSDKEVMDRIWSTVTNTAALAVNDVSK
jgi:hypothetical protein